MATLALFLFWTIPVTAVQALASLEKMNRVLALQWLAKLITSMGPEVVASVQTQLSSLILVSFRWLTLSSGLFQLLVRMQGAISATQIAARCVLHGSSDAATL